MEIPKTVSLLEIAAVVVSGAIACTVWMVVVLSSGNYFDNLAFQPAMPSSVEQAGKFSAPIAGVGMAEDTLVIIGQSGTGEIDASISDGAVYGVGYYSINGSDWKAFNLTGEKEGKGWIRSGEAGLKLGFKGSDFPVPAGVDAYVDNYVAIFSCTETNMGWDCREGKWQLLEFTVHVKVPEGEIPAGCGTCPAGYECVAGSCQEKSSGGIKLTAGETVILQLTGGQKYLIRVVGINGDGNGAKLYINGETIDVDQSGKSTVSRSALYLSVMDIMEFTANEDGFVEFSVEGGYTVIDSCPECIPSAGGGTGGGGGGGGGGGDDNPTCTPSCSCAGTICSGETCLDGCGGTCPGTIQPDCGTRVCGQADNGCGSCGSCNATAGENCINGTCVVGSCTGNCSCALTLCSNLVCDDGCGNPCTGLVQPDCGILQCGAAPNGCGSSVVCGTCTSGLCAEGGFCLPTLPNPPEV